jgi:hypothetical protein
MLLPLDLLLAPTTHILAGEPPVTSYFERGQFSLAQQLVDGLGMNMEKSATS